MFPIVLLIATVFSPFVIAEQSGEHDSTFFITYGRRGINSVFFEDTQTNNSTAWPATARPYGVVNLHMVGAGLNYTIRDLDGNISLNNTTGLNYTVIAIDTGANASTVWLVVTIHATNESGNATEEVHNFGRMAYGRESVSLVEEILPDTILRAEAERQLFRNVVATVVLIGLWLLMIYLLVVAVKRGRVLIH